MEKTREIFQDLNANAVELDISQGNGEANDTQKVVAESFIANQDEVIKFIDFLSKKELEDADIISFFEETLKSVYENKAFRHSYFKISAILQELKSKGSDLDVLSVNLGKLGNIAVREQYNENTKNSIFKLWDHCHLEISRFSYFDQFFWRNDKAKTELEKISLDYKKAKKDFNETQKGFKKVSDYMSNARSEYVTILGIFAAIMLAGIGGFSVLGGFAKEVTTISNYRFFTIVSFLGLILFNVVFMLIYMIARLTEKNIYTICTNSKKDRNSDCTKGDCENNCCGLERVRRRLPYIFWSNLVLVVVIILGLSLEYLVNQYVLADWLLILSVFIFIGLSLYYGIKNSKA